jgi:hypothetical protein
MRERIVQSNLWLKPTFLSGAFTSGTIREMGLNRLRKVPKGITRLR